MLCQKCGFGHMIDDSHRDIRVFKCWVCGDRIYPGYPKRSGAHVCSRCGSHMHETNELSLCMDCMKLLNIQTERLKGRTPSAPTARRAKNRLPQQQSYRA